MSDSQPTEEDFDNSSPSSPAQSYLTILPSDSVSTAGITGNSRDPVPGTVDPVLLHLGEPHLARSNPYPSHVSTIGSTISTISDLTDAPSSLLTPTLGNPTVAHSNLSTIPEHFLTNKKVQKSWVWDTKHGEKYLDGTKWRWRCQHCQHYVIYGLAL